MIISFTCIPLSYIAYILMAYLIFAKKNLSSSVQSRRNEISILVQSTFVTIYVTVLVLLWHITLFPPLMALIDMENRRNLAIMNSCYILHCYVNPIATLVCNKTIREKCLKIVGYQKTTHKKSVITSAASVTFPPRTSVITVIRT
ncbi:unnamed protein product [Caenorhabditis nigoni]